jgi:heat shock protein HtpX
MMIADMVRWGAIFGGMQRDDNREGGGGIISLIAMSVLAPIAAMVIQMAISRTREYAADETGARASGDPLGLASALGKLGAASERIPLDASPQTSRLFIVNPLSGRSLMQLFSTHPPLEERIARLQAMAGQRTGSHDKL